MQALVLMRRERPDLDVAPQGILGRLHRVAGQLTRELVTVFERHGLTEGEFDVLCALRRVGEPFARQPAELARHTMITTGGLTKRLDALDFAYGRLRDNRALDRIKRLGVSVFTLMDDHEIRDNYGGEPGELDAARRRYLNSQRAMWPPPVHSPGAPLWTTRQVAGHPCFLADTRSEREARTLANWRDARIYSPAQSAGLRQWIAERC